MPLNFPLSPAPGATHTFNGTTYTYTNSSWTATTGTSGGGGGGTTIIEDSALKTKRIALYQAVGRNTTQVNFVNCSASGQGVPTGKFTRYVPSATVYEKTDGVVYAQTTAAAYNFVNFELNTLQDTGFIPKRGFYLETTFGIHDIDSNAGHTFFAGFFSSSLGTTNEWKTNMLSVASRSIGLGYDNADTNWQIAVPRVSGGAGKVNTGVAKPTSNQQLFKAVFNVIAGSNIFNIKLYDASTSTLLFSYDITMQEDLDGNAALLRGYIPDYTALNFYQRLSSGVNSSKIAMMVSRLYAESAIS